MEKQRGSEQITGINTKGIFEKVRGYKKLPQHLGEQTKHFISKIIYFFPLFPL
jgi:hypothetical protein